MRCTASLGTASDTAVTADAVEIGFLMVISGHRTQTLTSLLGEQGGFSDAPREFKVTARCPGAGWGGLESGGRDRATPRAEAGWGLSFLQTPHPACLGRAGPRPRPSSEPGAPVEGRWPAAHTSLIVLGSHPAAHGQGQEGSLPRPGAFNHQRKGLLFQGCLELGVGGRK